MKEFWNNRYEEEGFAYGQEPNEYLKSAIAAIPIGKALFPCEGEGRNAVYASKLGWEVTAVDESIVGKTKAEMLAAMNNVDINYTLCPIEDFETDVQYDCISLIFAHFSKLVRQDIHRKLQKYLVKGGIVIIEAFNKTQLGKKSGGPQSLEMLYSIEEILDDFDFCDTINSENKSVYLNEGKYHVGMADVIRLTLKKK